MYTLSLASFILVIDLPIDLDSSELRYFNYSRLYLIQKLQVDKYTSRARPYFFPEYAYFIVSYTVAISSDVTATINLTKKTPCVHMSRKIAEELDTLHWTEKRL